MGPTKWPYVPCQGRSYGTTSVPSQPFIADAPLAMRFPEQCIQGLSLPSGHLAAMVLTPAFPPEKTPLDGAPIQEDSSREVPGAQSQHQGSLVACLPH